MVSQVQNLRERERSIRSQRNNKCIEIVSYTLNSRKSETVQKENTNVDELCLSVDLWLYSGLETGKLKSRSIKAWFIAIPKHIACIFNARGVN